MTPDQKKQVAERGYGTVKEVLHTATILREGWEMDNAAWLVEMVDGSIKVFTTSHGGVYLYTRDEAEANLAETEKSMHSLAALLERWPC